ncbi:hypothetical protein Hsar01_01013 [Haloferula sargassicola]|uniref:Uncharacterized protein n=1 Tax=Haloferula sargassicola TaxID=490096 RepID=A0ABP9UM75_9BACT
MAIEQLLSQAPGLRSFWKIASVDLDQIVP